MDTGNTIRIKILLLAKGLTQTDLAKGLGVTVQYLNMVINGKKKGLKLRKRLAKELGVPVKELFGEA